MNKIYLKNKIVEITCAVYNLTRERASY